MHFVVSYSDRTTPNMATAQICALLKATGYPQTDDSTATMMLYPGKQRQQLLRWILSRWTPRLTAARRLRARTAPVQLHPGALMLWLQAAERQGRSPAAHRGRHQRGGGHAGWG